MRLILSLSALFMTTCIFSQVPKKRLPQNINVPTYSHVFPTLSGDGNQMIFLTNYSNSEGYETKYSVKNGSESWEDPAPLESINKPGQDHIGSFCLSYDGNFVVFASRRTPTIGNFDIFISEKVNNYWTQPKNPGKPLNSPAHEGNPSMSPDGKSIYFTRCESMDNSRKNNCAIFVSHRVSPTRWSEPEKLPSQINNGHTTTPRILADNKTLVFASGKSGGKGRLDLYQSTLEYGSWSKPVALSYINTPENDEYVSIPARGDIIYFTGKYRDQHNIYKAIIPDEFRSKKVLMITGSVDYTDDQKPSEDVIIQAYDLASGDVFTTTRLRQKDNSYTIFLPEGAKYDISAFPQKGGHAYYSQIIDLENMLISRKEDLPISLGNVTPGMTIPLSTIRFEDYTSALTSESDIELKRIVGFMKKNQGIRLEIGAYIDSVHMDSIPSNDLTEVIMDTVFVQLEKPESIEEEFVFEDLEEDTLEVQTSTDSLENDHVSDTIENDLDSDSLVFEELENFEMDSITENEIEVELQISPADSLMAVGYELLEETELAATYFKVCYTYHNDRTQKQAEAVMEKLIAAGVPSHLVEAKGYADDWNEDLAEEERNYWIELRVIR